MGTTPIGARPRALSTLIALLTALALLASCSSSDHDADEVSSAFDRSAGAVEGDAPPGGSGGRGSVIDVDDRDADVDPGEPGPFGDGASVDSQLILTAADLGRSLVYVATVTIEVSNVLDATRQTQQTMAGLGGVLFGQDTTTSPRPRTVLVFKVQPNDFAETLARLEAIGRIVSLDASADDVTDRVVDLQSRIRSAEVSVERLRSLLDAANTLEAIAALEAQLLEREANLELLRGQLRTVQEQVALATVTVVLTEEASEPAAEVVVTAYDGDDEGERCPGERRLEIAEGEPAVLCVAIENTGNVALTKVEVRDPGLDLRREDFTLIGFGADDQLLPGETVTAWTRFDAGPHTLPRPNVSAVPVDDRGHPLRTSTVVTSDAVVLEILADEDRPGFGDAFATGWSGLQQVVGVAMVVVGLVLPFAVVAALPAGLWLWMRRRADEQITDDEPTGATSPA
jgi:hypothetical protein